MKEVFEKFGKVRMARKAFVRKGNRIEKVLGFVYFENEADAAAALESDVVIGHL